MEGRLLCRREADPMTLARRTAFVADAPLLHLTLEDQEIVRRCMVAVAGGLMREDDIPTVMGITLGELEGLIATWPNVEAEQFGSGAVALCLGWAYRSDVLPEPWAQYLGVSPDRIRWVYNRWRLACGRPPIDLPCVPDDPAG
jgi:hypothetical protein